MAPLPWQEADELSCVSAVYAQEAVYWRSLQDNENLMRLCGELSSAAGKSSESVEGYIEELCKLCWAEAVQVIDVSSLLMAAREEVSSLRWRLSQCNLITMKQMQQPDSDKDFEDLKECLSCSEERSELLRSRLEETEAHLAETKEALCLAEDRIYEVVQELEEAKGEEAQMAETKEALRLAEAHVSELGKELEEAQNKEVSMRAEYTDLEEEHKRELKVNETIRAEVAQLQSELAQYRALLQEKKLQTQSWRQGTVSSESKSRRQSTVQPESPSPSMPTPKLPLLRRGDGLSYADVSSSLQQSDPQSFTKSNKKMQGSTSLPALHRPSTESTGASPPSGFLPPVQTNLQARSKRPFV